MFSPLACWGGSVPAAPVRELTLQDAIEQALKYNLGLAIERQAPSLAREGLAVSHADFDPVFTLKGDASESRQAAAASELDGSAQPISQGQNLLASISKKISSGAQVSLDGQANRSESDSSYALLNPAYDANVGLSLRQPLLKGAGAAVNLLNIRLGEIAVSQSDLTLQAKVLDLLRDAEKTFWEVVYVRAAWKVREAAVQQAESVVRETEARQKAGLATVVDVIQAQAEAASRREAMLLAGRDILAASDRLLILLGRIKEDDPALTIAGDLSSAPVPASFAVEASMASARANQPEYKAQLAAIQGQRLQVDAARRNRRPSLDLAGQASYAGQSDSFGDAANSMANHDGYRWRVGIEFSTPWGLNQARAEFRKASIGLVQQNLRLDQLDQDLILRIRSAGRDLVTAGERMQAATVTRNLRAQQALMMRARYSAGTATLRDTLSAQNELEQAQLNELRARLDHITAAVELSRLEGRLPGRYGLRWAEVENPGTLERNP